MPPAKKKLSDADEQLIKDVKDELDKPNLPDDDQDSDVDKESAENEPKTSGEQGGNEDNTAVTPAAEVAEVRPVTEPCHRCFPDGWPAQEIGAFVNCAHEHAVIFGGDPVYIDRERAVELGFIEE